jgi:secretion/DNA translocation related CpaE-like protein
VGADAAAGHDHETPPPRRDDVAVITAGRENTPWRAAVRLGAERVLVLPDHQDELVGWMADAVEGTRRAHVIAVVAARGGAGASTLAVGLALAAARRGSVCLVDADPLSGGLELTLGSEDVAGLRWPEVVATEGRLGGATLRAALPHHRGVALLSWPRGSSGAIPPATMRAVMAAVDRAFDHVLVDLCRVPDAATVEALGSASQTLVVATDDVRSVAAASTVLTAVVHHGPDPAAVVRTTPTGAASPEAMAEALGLPLAAVVPTRRAVGRRIDAGFGPPRRGVLTRRCAEILDDVRRRQAV